MSLSGDAGGWPDVANCLETIPHEKLMQADQERVCDQAVLKLLRVMLRVGVMDGGQVRRSLTGTPQGGGCGWYVVASAFPNRTRADRNAWNRDPTPP